MLAAVDPAWIALVLAAAAILFEGWRWIADRRWRDAQRRGAVLSAGFRQGERTTELVVVNRGPAWAQLEAVTVTDKQVTLYDPVPSPDDPVELAPFDEFPIVVMVLMGVQYPIQFRLQWRDDEGEKSRIMKLR